VSAHDPVVGLLRAPIVRRVHREMHTPSSSFTHALIGLPGPIHIISPPNKRRDLPSPTFFRFIFRRFVRGRRGTSRDEPYGLADRSIDPDLGLHESIGSHGASAHRSKNEHVADRTETSISIRRSLLGLGIVVSPCRCNPDVRRKRRKPERCVIAGSPRTEDFGPKIVFFADRLAPTFESTRLPAVQSW
jgi:hypothetical protein